MDLTSLLINGEVVSGRIFSYTMLKCLSTFSISGPQGMLAPCLLGLGLGGGINRGSLMLNVSVSETIK